MAIQTLNTAGSTCVASATYDTESDELTINFVKGGSYSYAGVEPQVVRAFKWAGSKGRYFNRRIRNEY